MNRRVSGLAFAIAASSLAAAVFLLRNWAIPADGPIVIVKAPPPTSIAPRRRLPKALSVNPGRLPAPADPEPQRRARPGYDAATLETVRGRVAMSGPLDRRLRQGTPPQRLVLECAGEQIVVKLGPPRGLKRVGFDRLDLAPGDEVEVTGSRLAGRRHVMIAATVAKGDQTVVLRDDSGEPAWIPPPRRPHQRPRR